MATFRRGWRDAFVDLLRTGPDVAELEFLDVRTRGRWRTWLGKHHTSSRGVWMVFHKAHTGVKSMPYEDFVREALCFGWIDSLVKRLDDDRFAIKVTPRKPASKWSDINRRRWMELNSGGLLTPASHRLNGDCSFRTGCGRREHEQQHGPQAGHCHAGQQLAASSGKLNRHQRHDRRMRETGPYGVRNETAIRGGVACREHQKKAERREDGVEHRRCGPASRAQPGQ